MRYLDNAATTFPKPQSVVMAVDNCLKKFSANPGRGGHSLSIKSAEAVYKVRKSIAELFGCSNIENVIFTQNCTTSINTVLKGILKEGDHVICSGYEHNAVTRPLNKLIESGVTYDIASVFIGDDMATLNAFEALIKENTKLIICTHASNVCGAVMPIEKIGALAKAYGILFAVDAAQTAGVLSIDVKKNNIDYLCVAPHKGLYAPMGTGILIANSEINNTIIEGGTGSMSISQSQPEILPDRFESGTVNLSGIVGIGAGIDFIKSKGIANIYQSELNLISYLYEELRKIKGIELYTEHPRVIGSAPVLSFNMKGKHSEEVAEKLNNYGIATRAGLHCAPLAHKTLNTLDVGTVRVCPSVYTSKNDIEYLINCVKKVEKN